MYFDTEPLRTDPNPCSTYDLIYAFKWYQDNISTEAAAKFLKTDTTTAARFLTLCWTERLLSRGYVLPPKEWVSYRQQREAFDQYITEKAISVSERPKVDIQAAMKHKAMLFLADIEQELDDGKTDEWYQFFYKLDKGNGIRAAYVPFIIAEINSLKRITEDSKYLITYDNIIADLERIAKNKKAVAKVGKRKVIDATKVIKGLKFLKKSDEFKIESINPERIVGAKALYFFNVKIRQIAMYTAYEGGALTVKGSTLFNFDPEKSSVRTLRKPDEILPKILDSTKKQCEKLYGALTTKPLKGTGRINRDCVILRVES